MGVVIVGGGMGGIGDTRPNLAFGFSTGEYSGCRVQPSKVQAYAKLGIQSEVTKLSAIGGIEGRVCWVWMQSSEVKE